MSDSENKTSPPGQINDENNDGVANEGEQTSPAFDPNEHAEKLAELSVALSNRAQRHAESIRNADGDVITDPNALASHLESLAASIPVVEPVFKPQQVDIELQKYQEKGATDPSTRLSAEMEALQEALAEIQKYHTSQPEPEVVAEEKDDGQQQSEGQQDNAHQSSEEEKELESALQSVHAGQENTEVPDVQTNEDIDVDAIKEAIKRIEEIQSQQGNPQDEPGAKLHDSLDAALQNIEQAHQQEQQEAPVAQQQEDVQAAQEQTQQEDAPAAQEQTQQIDAPAAQEQTQQKDSPAAQEQTQQIDSLTAHEEQMQQKDSPAAQEQTQQIDSPAAQEQTQQIDSPAAQEQTQQIDSLTPQEEQTQQEDAPAAQEEEIAPKIIIKGAKFGGYSKNEDARTQDVIIANHVDEKRDEQVGVSISKYNLNYLFSEPDERDHKFKGIFGNIDAKYLPASTDLRPTWGDILDQLDLGSCVSNSVSYCVRYAYSKENLGNFTPSRLYIYYNGRLDAGYPLDEDTGMTIRDGYKSVAHYSVCSENNWPYIPDKFASRPPASCYDAAKEHSTFRYINLDTDEVQIKKSLKDGFPVSFGAALFESFMGAETARTGIVPSPNIDKEKRCGGHAMTIVGHDDEKKAFLVANNWGSTWGDKGFCWFPYDYMLNSELCGDLWSIRYWA